MWWSVWSAGVQISGREETNNDAHAGLLLNNHQVYYSMASS
jgi:hypothetical protein